MNTIPKAMAVEQVLMKSALIRFNPKGNKMSWTKAEYIEWAYDDAAYDDMPSEGCYALAVAAANELGGIETYNSNDGNRTYSFAPIRDFEFDDGSSVEVTYGGVFVILPNEPY